MIELFGEKPKPEIGRSLLGDVFVGLGAVLLLQLTLLLPGGFNFVVPWVATSVLLLFASGFVRGREPGTVWAKALALNVAVWTFLLIVVEGEWWARVLWMASTLLACIAGMIVRRRGEQKT